MDSGGKRSSKFWIQNKKCFVTHIHTYICIHTYIQLQRCDGRKGSSRTRIYVHHMHTSHTKVHISTMSQSSRTRIKVHHIHAYTSYINNSECICFSLLVCVCHTQCVCIFDNPLAQDLSGVTWMGNHHQFTDMRFPRAKISYPHLSKPEILFWSSSNKFICVFATRLVMHEFSY